MFALMVNEENMLIDNFYQTFNFFIITAIALILILIMVILFSIVKFKKITTMTKVYLLLFIIFLFGSCYFFGNMCWIYYADHIYLQNNEPILITGKVVGYQFAFSDDFSTNYSYPIIEDKKTHQQIILGVMHADERLVVNEEYTFIYLPNSKESEIVEYKTMYV